MKLLRYALGLGTVMGLLVTVSAQTPPSLAVELQRAIQKEGVTGDFKVAIEEYRRIVARAGSDKKIAAQALLRMAECYQKLGDAEARRIYERLVRDYGDQAEVAKVASARLNAAAPTSVVNRQLWSGPGVDTFGTVSPDGRYLSFVDRDTGDLAVRDLTAGTNRRLTNKGPKNDDRAQESVISPDGTQVAYAWFSKASYQIHLSRLDGGAPPRVLLNNPEIQYTAPFSWSPDGSHVAIKLTRKDRTAQIALLSTKEGSVKVLKTVDWRQAKKVLFSPDGRFVAYDLPSGDSVEATRDVYVLGIDGSGEVPAVVHPSNDFVVGWSPTGDHLLFASDRMGALGLWTVPMSNGKPHGDARPIKADLPAWGMGLTRTGTLVYGVQTGAIKVFTATVDFSTGKLVAPPKEVGETYVTSHRGPAWSADGKWLAFISQGRPTTLGVFSLENSRLATAIPELSEFAQLRPLSGQSLICNCTDLKGRHGVFRLDLPTAAATPLLIDEPDQYSFFPAPSPDGKLLVFSRAVGKGPASIMVRQLSDGKERELVAEALQPAVSPDGRLVAYIKANTLSVIPIDGGTPRALAPANGGLSLTEWTPDGKMIVTSQVSGQRTVAVAVPLNGAPPIQLDLPPDWRPMMFRIHPNGREITFAAGQSRDEVWTLENFLPAVKTAR
jgi:Tol biopolymer transport system component